MNGKTGVPVPRASANGPENASAQKNRLKEKEVTMADKNVSLLNLGFRSSVVPLETLFFIEFRISRSSLVPARRSCNDETTIKVNYEYRYEKIYIYVNPPEKTRTKQEFYNWLDFPKLTKYTGLITRLCPTNSHQRINSGGRDIESVTPCDFLS